jgi:hypothetical protein
MIREEAKTFKVTCRNDGCGRTFTLTCIPVAPEAAGEADKIEVCPFCGQEVVVTLPWKYIPGDYILRKLDV